MQEQVISIMREKAAANMLTLKDIDFAYKIGFYDGRIDVLKEQLKDRLQKNSTREK